MTIESDSYSSSSRGFSSSYDSDHYGSASTVTGHDDVPLAIFQQLEKEIGNKIHTGVDIAIFTREVWGLDDDAIVKLLSMPVVLDEAETGAYKQCSDDDDLHKSFITICGKLMRIAANELGYLANDSFRDTFWDRLRQNTAGAARYRVPDLISTSRPPPSDGSAPSLASAKAIFELKRPSQEIKDTECDADDDEAEEEESSAMPPACDDSECLNPVSTDSKPSLKRNFDSVGDLDDKAGGAAKKRRCEEVLPLRNCLLPLYAADTLASSSRYYVVGVLVDRFTVTVCYFDRFLVACVSSFSFEEEPCKLALVLYAMSQCESDHAGLDPHIRPTCSHISAADAKLEEHDQPRPMEGLVGSYFEYPADSAQKGGQCSDSPSSDSTACFRVSGVLRRPVELIGRATAVYKVRRRVPDGTFSEEEYAFKFSWPPKSRLSEIEIVKMLKERLPEEAHAHLPDFLFTTTSTAEDLNLPWLRLGLSLTDVNHQERELRCMMGKLYYRLWEVGTIENFKQAWLDCLECLYLVRKMGKALHRDISEGNLMFLKVAENEVKGVLNDWDMARFMDQLDDHLENADLRTGTLPFMALDLLKSTYHSHCFRHDLESMFYVLIWAALHYNLKAKTREATVHPSVVEWTRPTDDTWEYKSVLFTYEDYPIKRIYAGVKPEFASLVKEWIEPIRKLFTNARSAHARLREADKECDESTYSGALTYKTYMAAIQVTPRTWGIPDFLDEDGY